VFTNEVVRWLLAFLLTVAVEVPLATLCFRAAETRVWTRLGKLFFANLATYPLVWFAFPLLPLSAVWNTAFAEGFAWLTEVAFFCFVFPKASLRRAAIVSGCANAASFVVGLAAYRLSAWPS
jgi:hypothetical protein